jgi:hypothetical protein
VIRAALLFGVPRTDLAVTDLIVGWRSHAGFAQDVWSAALPVKAPPPSI